MTRTSTAPTDTVSFLWQRRAELADELRQLAGDAFDAHEAPLSQNFRNAARSLASAEFVQGRTH